MIRRSPTLTILRRLADAIVVLWGWRRLAVAGAAGAASALAFAPFHLFPVLWLTMPVLVWLIDGVAGRAASGRALAAAAVGWSFGFGFFVAGMWWVGVAFVTGGDGLAWLAPFAVVLLAALLALFWAAGAAAARLFWPEGWARVPVLAVALAAAEWLRGHLFTGLPWNAFGYALAANDVMMQAAAIVGLWGLTLAAFLVFAAPAVLADIDGPARRPGLALIAAALALLAVQTGYGAVRLALAGPPAADGTPVRIVQPDIPQAERWDIARANDAIGRYVALSTAGGRPGEDGAPAILVWPETAFPFYFAENPRALAAVADVLGPGAVLIAGAARRDPSAPGAPAFNAVYLFDDNGVIRGAYDKMHLVPFGEYLPWRDVLGALGLGQLVAIPGGFAPGASRTLLEVPDGPAVAPLVCFEAIFPGAVVARGARPDWLVNLTNDGWFGATPGPWQHLHQARLRAVEEGLPMIRAANSGVSAIVDPYGRVTAALGYGQMGALNGRVATPLAPTPQARVGDITFAVLLIFVALIAGFGTVAKERRGN